MTQGNNTLSDCHKPVRIKETFGSAMLVKAAQDRGMNAACCLESSTQTGKTIQQYSNTARSANREMINTL